MAKRRRHNATGRTTGESRFVQIPYWVLETDAARRLSGTATKVLLYLLKRHNGANNGRIAFGARSGCFRHEPGSKELIDASIEIGPSATSAALYELKRAGFIRCTKDSTFDQKRTTREWRLTWLPVGTTPETKEFTTAQGDFKRSKKQKPVRQRALPPQLQRASAHEGTPETPPIESYSALAHTMTDAHSAPARTHLVTIPSEAANVARAVQDIGLSVSAAVLHSPLASAARGPQGSQRARATAPKVDLSSVLASRMQPRART